VSGTASFVVEPGGGEMIRSPLAGPMLLKAQAGTTGGHFTLLENEVPPKAGPALHRHHNEDEMYYVLEGTFRFKLADRIELAPPGAFVYIPKGTPHCFQNLGDEPARFLVMFTPSGMERFFEGTASLPPGPMDTDAHRTIARDCAMEILGPPLAISDPL
jgi:mannose-6-phosphate isomerase-like protein (cupin superfamily)